MGPSQKQSRPESFASVVVLPTTDSLRPDEIRTANARWSVAQHSSTWSTAVQLCKAVMPR